MLKLKKANVEKFLPIYKNMCTQFPISELKSYETFINLLKTADYNLYLATYNTRTIGYCLLYKDKKNSVLWIDYIAIYKDFQSKGYGSEIFNSLKKLFNEYKGIYIEVEKENQELINTIKRINFYNKLGAQKLKCKYYYPNNNGGLEMDLFFLPIQAKVIPHKERIKNTISNVFTAIHKDIYLLNEILEKIVI